MRLHRRLHRLRLHVPAVLLATPLRLARIVVLRRVPHHLVDARHRHRRRGARPRRLACRRRGRAARGVLRVVARRAALRVRHHLRVLVGGGRRAHLLRVRHHLRVPAGPLPLHAAQLGGDHDAVGQHDHRLRLRPALAVVAVAGRRAIRNGLPHPVPVRPGGPRALPWRPHLLRSPLLLLWLLRPMRRRHLLRGARPHRRLAGPLARATRVGPGGVVVVGVVGVVGVAHIVVWGRIRAGAVHLRRESAGHLRGHRSRTVGHVRARRLGGATRERARGAQRALRGRGQLLGGRLALCLLDGLEERRQARARVGVAQRRDEGRERLRRVGIHRPAPALQRVLGDEHACITVAQNKPVVTSPGAATSLKRRFVAPPQRILRVQVSSSLRDHIWRGSK